VHSGPSAVGTSPSIKTVTATVLPQDWISACHDPHPGLKLAQA
jgi:hypothetical protein